MDFDPWAALAAIRAEAPAGAIRASCAIPVCPVNLDTACGGNPAPDLACGAIRASRAIPSPLTGTDTSAPAPGLEVAALSTSPTDPAALFSYLRGAGPATYGAAAMTLGWGATRAWQAEAALRGSGRVRLDFLGRMITP